MLGKMVYIFVFNKKKAIRLMNSSSCELKKFQKSKQVLSNNRWEEASTNMIYNIICNIYIYIYNYGRLLLQPKQRMIDDISS